ncbi:MAG: hypothetical protein F4X98_18110 [Gammaproteobacteria bacterium]|nr:hypothetical protein [Gammaproteobacteria bacterium]
MRTDRLELELQPRYPANVVRQVALDPRPERHVRGRCQGGRIRYRWREVQGWAASCHKHGTSTVDRPGNAHRPPRKSTALSEDRGRVTVRAERGIRAPDPDLHGAGYPHIYRRVLEMTLLTIDKIDRNPALAQTDLNNIEWWARQNGGHVPSAHAEWK